MAATGDLDPKALVRQSYNRISRAYRGDAVSRDRGYFQWLAQLTPRLQPGDPVLDLGCGCGILVAQELARDFRVTGVDISEVQITRARALVPEAAFLCRVDYAFQHLRLKRIVATTTYENAASMGVMRKLGMRIERNPYPEPPWLQIVGVLENSTTPHL